MRRALTATLACAGCLALSAPARAWDVPLEHDAALAQARWVGASLGRAWAVDHAQLWAEAAWDVPSDGLSLRLGAARALYQGPTWGLRLSTQAGPLAVWRDERAVGARLLVDVQSVWRAGITRWLIAPRLDTAALVFGPRQGRARVMALGGFGVTLGPATIWLHGASGYTLGGQGAGALASDAALSVSWAL